MKPLIQTMLVLSIILLIMQFFQAETVFQRDDITRGQWWRILSGNLTHSNFPHLFLNLAGLWVFGLLFIDNLTSKTFIVSTIFLGFFTGVCLYFFNPELLKYYGFSGILYGLFIIGAINAMINKELFIGVLVALTVTGKIAWDFYNGGSSSSVELIGIPVATDAHLYGFIGAIIISVILLALHFANPNNKKV